MKIYTPGFPVRYVDEEPPVNEAPVIAPETQVLSFPSIEEAIKLAEARSSAALQNAAAQETAVVPNPEQVEASIVTRQTINFPTDAKPLVDNQAPGAAADPAVNPSAFLEQKAAAEVVAEADAELLK